MLKSMPEMMASRLLSLHGITVYIYARDDGFASSIMALLFTSMPEMMASRLLSWHYCFTVLGECPDN